LAVLLQLGNQLIALANHILVLLVLVIRPVRLNDALARDTINGTGDAATSNKLR
jgi:hypothetical protein